VEALAPDGFAEAIEISRLEWASRLGADLGPAPRVRWFKGHCLRYLGDDGPCLAGRFYSYPGEEPQIHLTVSRPSLSALPHEMLHWALDEVGDSDSDHRTAPWLEVQDVRMMLAGAGL